MWCLVLCVHVKPIYAMVEIHLYASSPVLFTHPGIYACKASFMYTRQKFMPVSM